MHTQADLESILQEFVLESPQVVRADDTPSFILAGGGSGSNKGIIIKRMKAAGIIPESSFYLDSEFFLIHDLIPGCAQTRANGIRHPEHLPQFEKTFESLVGYITERYFELSKIHNRQANLIIDDHFGSLEFAKGLIASAKRSGAETILVATSIDPRLAIVREDEREIEVGTALISRNVYLETFRSFAQNYSLLSELVDASILFQNNAFVTMNGYRSADLSIAQTSLLTEGFPIPVSKGPVSPHIIEVVTNLDGGEKVETVFSDYEKFRFLASRSFNTNAQTPAEVYEKENSPENLWLREYSSPPVDSSSLDVKSFAAKLAERNGNLRDKISNGNYR